MNAVCQVRCPLFAAFDYFVDEVRKFVKTRTYFVHSKNRQLVIAADQAARTACWLLP